MRRLFVRIRPYLSSLGLLLALALVNTALAAPDPQGTTNQICGFGSGETSAIQRVVGGLGMLLMALALLLGGLSMRSGSGGGGGGAEMAASGLGAMAGLAIIFGLLGVVGLFAALTMQAAGLPACP